MCILQQQSIRVSTANRTRKIRGKLYTQSTNNAISSCKSRRRVLPITHEEPVRKIQVAQLKNAKKFDPDTANERLWIRIRRVFEEAGVLAINCWAFLQRDNTEVQLQNKGLFESTRLYCFQEFRCIRQRRSKYAKGAGTG